MFKKILFKTTTTLIAALSIFSMPISAVDWNQSCCQPNDCCQEESPCCSSNGSSIWKYVGAAAIGAAAGALTAAAVESGKNGKHGGRGTAGPMGPTGLPGLAGGTGGAGLTGTAGAIGPTGPTIFATSDETLVFNFNLTLTAALRFSSPITTFVQKPDGSLIFGPNFDAGSLLPQSATITIGPSAGLNGPVEVGTYHWGYVFPESLFELTLDLNDFVNELPDNVNVYPDNSGVGLFVQLVLGGDTQYIHNYSFDID